MNDSSLASASPQFTPRPRRAVRRIIAFSLSVGCGALLIAGLVFFVTAISIPWGKLRGNMDAADYKNVVLGLIFLKYISDAFQEQYEKLKKEPHANPEDRDEYTGENIFWVRVS